MCVSWPRRWPLFEAFISWLSHAAAPSVFTLAGENESLHLASSINLVIDVLIDGSVIQLIEHLHCGLSLFRVCRYTAQQPATRLKATGQQPATRLKATGQRAQLPIFFCVALKAGCHTMHNKNSLMFYIIFERDKDIAGFPVMLWTIIFIFNLFNDILNKILKRGKKSNTVYKHFSTNLLLSLPLSLCQVTDGFCD